MLNPNKIELLLVWYKILLRTGYLSITGENIVRIGGLLTSYGNKLDVSVNFDTSKITQESTFKEPYYKLYIAYADTNEDEQSAIYFAWSSLNILSPS